MAMNDASCPKCKRRFGWSGELRDCPPCPRCGYQIDPTEWAETERQMAEARKAIFGETDDDDDAGKAGN